MHMLTGGKGSVQQGTDMEAMLKEVPEERDALVWGFGVESFTNKIIYFIQKYLSAGLRNLLPSLFRWIVFSVQWHNKYKTGLSSQQKMRKNLEPLWKEHFSSNISFMGKSAIWLLTTVGSTVEIMNLLLTGKVNVFPAGSVWHFAVSIIRPPGTWLISSSSAFIPVAITNEALSTDQEFNENKDVLYKLAFSRHHIQVISSYNVNTKTLFDFHGTIMGTK